MSDVCLERINNQADVLSNNPGVAYPLPIPIIFATVGTTEDGPSLIGCSGQYNREQHYRDVNYNPSTVFQIVSPFLVTSFVTAIYVPPRWRVSINGTYYPPAVTTIPVVYNDLAINVNNDDIFFSPPATSNDKGLNYVDEWKYNMCTATSATIMGSRYLTSYKPSSAECDAFFDTYCSTRCEKAYLACDQTTEEKCDPMCACRLGERDIRCSFDTEQETISQFIPVTCMNKGCAEGGYRWSHMRDQKCNVQLCQQVVDMVGNNITMEGGQTLVCGNTRADTLSIRNSDQDVPASFTTEKETADGTVPDAIPDWLLATIALATVIVVSLSATLFVMWPKISKYLNSSTSGAPPVDQ